MDESSSTPSTKVRKAKSNDPGWKYVFWLDEHDKNIMKCELCGLITNGGIKRQKEHLIGWFSDVKKCSNTTKEIADKMLSWLNKNEKRKIIYCESTTGDEDNSFDEETIERQKKTSTLSGKKSLTSNSNNNKTKGPMYVFARKSVEDFADARSGTKLQTIADSRLKKEEKKVLEKAIVT